MSTDENLAFRGTRIFFAVGARFNSDYGISLHELMVLASQSGGEVVEEATAATYIVAWHARSYTYPISLAPRGPQLVSVLWFFACLDAHAILHTAHPLYAPFRSPSILTMRDPPFRVSVSGFQGRHRTMVRTLLVCMGVSFQPQLHVATDERDDLLVVQDLTQPSAKLEAAQRHGIPAVTLQWVIDSLQQWALLPVDPYTTPSPVTLIFPPQAPPSSLSVISDSEEEYKATSPHTHQGQQRPSGTTAGRSGTSVGGGGGGGGGGMGPTQAMGVVGGFAALFGATEGPTLGSGPSGDRLQPLHMLPPRGQGEAEAHQNASSSEGTPTPSQLGMMHPTQGGATTVLDDGIPAPVVDVPATEALPVAVAALETEAVAGTTGAHVLDLPETALLDDVIEAVVHEERETRRNGDGHGAKKLKRPTKAPKDAPQDKHEASAVAKRGTTRGKKAAAAAVAASAVGEGADVGDSRGSAAARRSRRVVQQQQQQQQEQQKEQQAVVKSPPETSPAPALAPATKQQTKKKVAGKGTAGSNQRVAEKPPRHGKRKAPSTDTMAAPLPPNAAVDAGKRRRAAPPSAPPAHMHVALSGLHRGQQEALSTLANKLGVQCTAGTHTWQPGTTHVVAPEVKRNQKCLCALAAGAWLVGPPFLEAAAGGAGGAVVVDPARHELHRAGSGGNVSPGVAAHWRKAVASSGGAGAFSGITFAVGRTLDGPPSRDDICAIIKAGGGEVLPLSQTVDVVVVASAAAGSAATLARVKEGALCVTPLYIVEWLAKPSSSLEAHVLLGSGAGAAVRAAAARRKS